MLLLDTNVCIEIISGTSSKVVNRFRAAVRSGLEIYVSSISTFELWYGVEKSAHREFNRKQLDTFLAGSLQLLPFGEEDAVHAGEARGILEKRGKPIGPFDVLIAGQALARGLVLVTHNMRKFKRVPGLEIEDWQA